MKLSRSLLPLVTALSFANALGQKQIISFDGSDDDLFQLVGGKVDKGQILVSKDDYWGVIRAAGDLAMDFGRVTGTNLSLSNGEDDADPATFMYKPVDVSNNTIVSERYVARNCSALMSHSTGRRKRSSLRDQNLLIQTRPAQSLLLERSVTRKSSTI